MEFKHKPVLLKETIDGLNIKEDGIYVDGTLGGAGHSKEILKNLDSSKGMLIGIDRDEEALNAAKQNLSKYSNVIYIHNNHDNIQEILKESRFDFGFRVINEIVRFMAVAWKYESEPSEFANWERYFDAQIKQKILPKLHGSEKIIGDTIQDLQRACLRESGFIKYKASYRKLEEMRNVLDKQRYVSFIN